MEAPASDCINQIGPERQCFLLSLGDVPKVERCVERLRRAGSEKVHHVRGTDRRTFLQWWRRQEIVLVEARGKFVGLDVIDKVLRTELELSIHQRQPRTTQQRGHTSTNSIFFSLNSNLSLQLLLPKYARRKARKNVASVNSFSCSSLQTCNGSSFVA